MRKARILLVLGIWVAILPYLGFPYSWKSVLTTLSGLALIIFSYVLYRDFKMKEGEVKTFDNFRENSDFSEIENENGNQHENEIEVEVLEEEPKEYIKSPRGEI